MINYELDVKVRYRMCQRSPQTETDCRPEFERIAASARPKAPLVNQGEDLDVAPLNSKAACYVFKGERPGILLFTAYLHVLTANRRAL